MFRAERTQSNSVNYQRALLGVIDKYIEENKNKWFRKTGIARARALRNSILLELGENQRLSSLQLMWRMYAYIKMDRGVGPLDTSRDLRDAMLNHLCSFLEINESSIKALETKKTAEAATYILSQMNAGMTGNYIDTKRIADEARLELVFKVMASHPKGLAPSSREFKDRLVEAIDGYQKFAKTRWFRGEGIERAENLKKYISVQLVDREQLNDRQLCVRMFEMLRMPAASGQGLLGSSKDLRHVLLKCMCDYLRVDENKLLKEISLEALPISAGTIASNIGPAIYFPDHVEVSTRIRIKYIQAALNAKQTPAVSVEHKPYEFSFGR